MINSQNTTAAKILTDNGIEVIKDFGLTKNINCMGNWYTAYKIQVKDYENGTCCSHSIKILKDAGFEKVGFSKQIESLQESQFILLNTEFLN